MIYLFYLILMISPAQGQGPATNCSGLDMYYAAQNITAAGYDFTAIRQAQCNTLDCYEYFLYKEQNSYAYKSWFGVNWKKTCIKENGRYCSVDTNMALYNLQTGATGIANKGKNATVTTGMMDTICGAAGNCAASNTLAFAGTPLAEGLKLYCAKSGSTYCYPEYLKHGAADGNVSSLATAVGSVGLMAGLIGSSLSDFCSKTTSVSFGCWKAFADIQQSEMLILLKTAGCLKDDSGNSCIGVMGAVAMALAGVERDIQYNYLPLKPKICSIDNVCATNIKVMASTKPDDPNAALVVKIINDMKCGVEPTPTKSADDDDSGAGTILLSIVSFLPLLLLRD